ncbi:MULTISPECIES: hypothetical protein [unclassified Streptomyces]|uniref:hypothetical protein n=1 Tax=unclassified Streptomyces TaxID=2593676 RepID=UPI0038704601|nr:hypothetical protein OG331_03995 [Streptomyces sp. NBC_01017]WSV34794.1 hypothetical protein OG331_47985 [Streptomyces sp. NBC_01017]
MSGMTATAADVTSQYTTQVTSDLEHNVQEQERLGAEISALQEKLSRLQRDHSVLVTVAQALGVSAPAPAGTGASTSPLPSPRHQEPAPLDAERDTPAVQPPAPAAATPSTTAKNNARRPSSDTDDKPTLVELTRRRLAGQEQPHSAAQIAQALQDSHPERGIKITVVRTTLENLVAKNQARRTKKGSSVFYSAPAAPQAD